MWPSEPLLFPGQDWAALTAHWVRGQPCPPSWHKQQMSPGSHLWPWVPRYPVCARERAESTFLSGFGRDVRGRAGHLTTMCISTSASRAESPPASLWAGTVPMGSGHCFSVPIQWSQMMDRTNKDVEWRQLKNIPSRTDSTVLREWQAW